MTDFTQKEKLRLLRGIDAMAKALAEIAVNTAGINRDFTELMTEIKREREEEKKRKQTK